MAGRPRKPAKLKTGHNQSKSDLQKDAQKEKFVGGGNDNIIIPPKNLNNQAKHYYVYIVENLKNSGILSNLDVFVVEQTAICLARMDEMDDVLNKQSSIQYREDAKGYWIPYEHPAVSIKNKYMQQFKTLSTQLGLTPSSRSQLASLDVEEAQKKQDPIMNALRGESNDDENSNN